MQKRFPALADILPVLAVIAVMFYGWSMVVFLWKLPGWLFFLSLGEIAIIFSYELVTNLAESLFILALLLVCAALLPARFLRNDFIPRGSAAALVLVGALLLINYLDAQNRLGPPAYWPVWLLTAVFAAIALAWIAARVGMAGRALAWLADRLIVFLVLLLPLSGFAFAALLTRYLFRMSL